MDINIDDLPLVIYACFILNNYCELNNEYVHDELVKNAVSYDQDFQPPTQANRYVTDRNEIEGKWVRNVLAMFSDPWLCNLGKFVCELWFWLKFEYINFMEIM